MSPRTRPGFLDILGETIWWGLLSWLVVVLVGGIALNYRNLNVTGLIPMLRSVGDGISVLLKSYWPLTIGIAVVLGMFIARRRNP